MCSSTLWVLAAFAMVAIAVGAAAFAVWFHERAAEPEAIRLRVR
jgi:hypothetical protein